MGVSLKISIVYDVLELYNPDGLLVVPGAVEFGPLPPELLKGGTPLSTRPDRSSRIGVGSIFAPH
jgi:hypothetical protein